MAKFKRLAKVIEFLTEAHAGQFDLEGYPYITHCVRVADNLRFFLKSHGLDVSESLLIVAVAHDAIEDCPNVDLRTAGVTDDEIYIIELLSKNGKTEEEYWRGILSCVEAGLVKYSDLLDNTNPNRQPINPSEKHIQRQQKYQHQISDLKALFVMNGLRPKNTQ